MLRSLLCALLSMPATAADAPDIGVLLEARYENKMISSGSNRPAIRLDRDNLRDILVLGVATYLVDWSAE